MSSVTNTQALEKHFELKRSTPIAALNLTVEEYEHPATGAVHLHLSSDNSENVFMVALRTVPEDSTGVAHILEHTVLCGSERYPVRDPFFMMLRRSLNTFMMLLPAQTGPHTRLQLKTRRTSPTFSRSILTRCSSPGSTLSTSHKRDTESSLKKDRMVRVTH